MPENSQHQLVWDIGDPDSETNPVWIIKANYASLEEAIEQGRHNVSLGMNVLGVVNLTHKTAVHEMSEEEREGHYVWTPKDDE